MVSQSVNWWPVPEGVERGGEKVLAWFILEMRGSPVDLEQNKVLSHEAEFDPILRWSIHLSLMLMIPRASWRI